MGLCGCAVVHCIPSKRDGPHRFVNPKKNKDLFKIWIKALGNKYLLDLDEHYVYQHYRVCSIHFIEEDFGPNHGLKRTLKSTAFPKLFLPVPMKIPADYSGLDILNSIKIDHDYAGQENAMGISDVINNSHDTTTIGRPFQVDKMFSEPVLDYRDGNCSLKTLSVKRLTELTPMKNDLCQAIKDLKRQKEEPGPSIVRGIYGCPEALSLPEVMNIENEESEIGPATNRGIYGIPYEANDSDVENNLAGGESSDSEGLLQGWGGGSSQRGGSMPPREETACPPPERWHAPQRGDGMSPREETACPPERRRHVPPKSRWLVPPKWRRHAPSKRRRRAPTKRRRAPPKRGWWWPKK